MRHLRRCLLPYHLFPTVFGRPITYENNVNDFRASAAWIWNRYRWKSNRRPLNISFNLIRLNAHYLKAIGKERARNEKRGETAAERQINKHKHIQTKAFQFLCISSLPAFHLLHLYVLPSWLVCVLGIFVFVLFVWALVSFCAVHKTKGKLLPSVVLWQWPYMYVYTPRNSGERSLKNSQLELYNCGAMGRPK